MTYSDHDLLDFAPSVVSAFLAAAQRLADPSVPVTALCYDVVMVAAVVDLDAEDVARLALELMREATGEILASL